jgi:RNA polymerase sigma-70 factor (ECF subfamily)
MSMQTRFRTFYQETSPRLFRYLRRHCAANDVEDILAEVYLIAWRRFADVPGMELPWLIATARNVLANHWRTQQRGERAEAEMQALYQLAAEPDPANQALSRMEILDALGRLSPDDREVLLLAGWDGLDSAALGKALGCTAVTARVRLSRARRRFDAAIRPAPAQSAKLAHEGV